MRKFPFLAGLVVLAASAPAAAQYETRYYGVSNIDTRIARLEERVDRQVERGRLYREEAAEIDRDIRGIRTLQRQYSRNGFNQWELDDLARRIDGIEAELRDNRRPGEGGFYDDGPYQDWRDDREWRDREDWRDRDRDPPGRYEERDRNDLQPVPDRLRYRYRDTDRSYFRYRDGYVFEFDRRTGAIVNNIWVGN